MKSGIAILSSLSLVFFISIFTIKQGEIDDVESLFLIIPLLIGTVFLIKDYFLQRKIKKS